jgi:hypothetical protein
MKRRPTLGFMAMGALSMGMGAMMPEVIMLGPFAYWHPARDLYVGISPYGEIWPLYGFAYYVSATVWAQYLRMGYYEEDWFYTQRNITDLIVEVGPQVFPADAASDTAGAVGAMAGALTVSHGIPWGRSSSLVLEGQGGLANANDPFLTAELGEEGASDLYANGMVKARVVMPIAKNINRGHALYADALYWSAFYEGSIIANRRFINEASAGDVRRLLVDRGSSRDACLTHTVGGDITMGLFKNYLFFRTLTVSGSYELLYDKVFVDVSLTF